MNDGIGSEPVLASAVELQANVVSELLALMLKHGYVETAGSDSEFRITALGLKFLYEFQGMRKFLA